MKPTWGWNDSMCSFDKRRDKGKEYDDLTKKMAFLVKFIYIVIGFKGDCEPFVI